ncbi:MAG TPA: T9SS type A sorting domain-containing protein [Bacteroidia bacterium]|nr:T9SS type A sorting domain-containing protein [Bacteroidia bacterium]
MNFRKINGLLALLVVGCSTLTAAQTPVFGRVWDRRFGGTLDDNISMFQLLPDSGFIIGGTSQSGISGDKTQNNWDPSLTATDFWLVRTDSSSNKVWDKRYGGFNTEVLGDVTLTGDGGYICGGQSYSGISGDKSQSNWDASQQSNDYWIIKIDSNGTKQWDKRFGGTSFDIYGATREATDGGYYVTGSSLSGISGDKTELNEGSWDFWVIRTNSTGNKIWDHTFGGLNDEFVNWCEATDDGGVIVGGYSNSIVSGDKSEPSQGTWDYWLIKIDSSGNKVWDKTLGGTFQDYLFSICKTSDGGYIAAGQSYSGQSGDKSEPNHDLTTAGSDYWIVKLDASGNKLWDRTYGASEVEQLSRVVETADHGLLLCGESYSPVDGDKTEDNLGVEQSWVVKTDSVGTIEWDKTIFTTGHDELGTAVMINDRCFAVANYTYADTGGYKTQPIWGGGDYWIVKLCSDDPLGIPQHNSNPMSLQVFPNPSSAYAEFIIPSALSGPLHITLTDMSGRSVFSQQMAFRQLHQQKYRIDVSPFTPGMYILTVENGSTRYRGRLLKK